MSSPAAAVLPALCGVRVLQVIDADVLNYPPSLNTARAFAASGAQVVCLSGMRTSRPVVAMPAAVALRFETFGSWDQVGVRRLHWGLGRFAFRQAVARAASQLRPHLVIAYDPGAGWAVLPLLERRVGAKIVFHLHDNLNLQHESWRSIRSWQWRALRRRLDAFDALVVPEAMRARDLRETWRVHARYRVVANAPLREVPERNRVLRERLGLSDEAKIAIVVGRMGLMGPAATALADAPHWHLVVVGADGGPEVAALQHAADRVGVSARVHVLPYVEYDTMRVWLRGCDVGVALYPADAPTVNWRLMGTGSVKVMEYMAAGLPSLVCSRQAFASLAADTGALEILDEESASGIARALGALSVPAHREQLARAAREAHLGPYHLEAQLAPLLAELGLRASP